MRKTSTERAREKNLLLGLSRVLHHSLLTQVRHVLRRHRLHVQEKRLPERSTRS